MRVSTGRSYPHTRSSSRSRENTIPRFRVRNARRSNSFAVRLTVLFAGANLAPGEVDLHFGDPEHPGLIFIAASGRAPQHGLDPRDELARAERFGDVVVGTELEPEDPIHLRIACRQHHDREPVAGGAEAPADLDRRPCPAASRRGSRDPVSPARPRRALARRRRSATRGSPRSSDRGSRARRWIARPRRPGSSLRSSTEMVRDEDERPLKTGETRKWIGPPVRLRGPSPRPAYPAFCSEEDPSGAAGRSFERSGAAGSDPGVKAPMRRRPVNRSERIDISRAKSPTLIASNEAFLPSLQTLVWSTAVAVTALAVGALDRDLLRRVVDGGDLAGVDGDLAEAVAELDLGFGVDEPSGSAPVVRVGSDPRPSRRRPDGRPSAPCPLRSPLPGPACPNAAAAIATTPTKLLASVSFVLVRMTPPCRTVDGVIARRGGAAVGRV